MLELDSIKKFYKDYGGHGFDHVERVHKMAMMIAQKEKADLQTVDAAAWLHDIARAGEDEGKYKCHAEEGAKIAGRILGKMNFPKQKIGAIQHGISAHRFSKQIKAETKEAQILQDADRLDALGAICIARVFMYNGFKKGQMYDPKRKPEKHYHGQETTAINHFYEKILKIKPEKFHTLTARKIAKERYEFIVSFLKKFKSEWNSFS
jgi:uncharacterized protein